MASRRPSRLADDRTRGRGRRLLALAALAGGLMAPPASARQVAPCAGPRPLPGDGTFRWLAQPGLDPVARALRENVALRRPLPGIGPVEGALGPGAAAGETGRADPRTGRPGGGADTADGGPAGPEPDRVRVYLLADLGCLDDLGLSGAQPDWVAGVASHAGRFIALRADRARGDLETLPATFRHEVAHLALHEATAGHAPRWLQEGYAQWAAGSWDWREAWRLRFVFFRGGGDFLRELRLGFPASEGEARTAYLLSYTAVQELASLAGPGGLATFFSRLREGGDVDEALRATFGLTADQFEERWRKAVEGRYGILYILSRATVFWVAVTLLLLWFGWRRKKRDREKMERLREEERLAEAWWGRLVAGWGPGAEGGAAADRPPDPPARGSGPGGAR